MAQQTTAPALHAARTVLRNYTASIHAEHCRDWPKLRATDAHLAVWIDHTTNVKNVAELRPEIRYWQERLTARTAGAGQILLFVKRLLEALRTIPGSMPTSLIGPDPEVDAGALPSAGPMVSWLTPMPRPGKVRLGQYSLAAARALNWYYVLVPKKPLRDSDAETLFLDVARIIEGCLGIAKPLRALKFLDTVAKELARGSIEEHDVRVRMKDVGVLFDQMPHYEDMREETKLLV